MLKSLRIFTMNYNYCYVLFYDMFWQYNQIMHYILDIINMKLDINMINGVMTDLGFRECDINTLHLIGRCNVAMVTDSHFEYAN